MPLLPPIDRDLIHSRAVQCHGYRREDGLWDIEGRITDTKTYSFITDYRGDVPAGAAVHDMWIRLTVDDDLEVKAIQAVTDSSPFPEICPQISPAYQAVVGLKIGRGWTRALKERLSGIHGCTHLTELLGPIATTAFQTIFPYLARQEALKHDPHSKKTSGMASRANVLKNTCHAFDENGPIIQAYHKINAETDDA